MPVSTDLPGKLDFRWYSGNDHTVNFVWDSALNERTFEFRTATATIDASVATATATATVPALLTTVKQTQQVAWALVETTDGDVTLAGGTIRWASTYDDAADTETVNVTADATTVAVTTGTLIFGTTVDGGSAAGTGSGTLDGGSA